MPLIVKHGYRRKYAVGGRGLFDTITNLAGRMFTSSAAKTLGSKAMNAATNAAMKGMEKGAIKAVDHVARRITRKKKTTSSKPKRTPGQQTRLNNLISGSGIATIHDFVQRYKAIHNG